MATKLGIVTLFVGTITIQHNSRVYRYFAYAFLRISILIYVMSNEHHG